MRDYGRMSGKKALLLGGFNSGSGGISAIPDNKTIVSNGGVWSANYSNPNLLDNGYLADPINQRGRSEYPSAGICIDRWMLNSSCGTVKIENGCVKLTVSGFTTWISQSIESPGKFRGKTVTLSVLYALGSTSGPRLRINGTAISGEQTVNTGSFRSLAFAIPDNEIESLAVEILVGANSSCKIIAAKLELGSRQTLARLENGSCVLSDPPPDKGLELMKCQRYYQLHSEGSNIAPADLRPQMYGYPDTQPTTGTINVGGTNYTYYSVEV